MSSFFYKVEGFEPVFVKLRIHNYHKVVMILWFFGFLVLFLCFSTWRVHWFTGSLVYPGSFVPWSYGSLYLFPDSMVSTSLRVHKYGKVGPNLRFPDSFFFSSSYTSPL